MGFKLMIELDVAFLTCSPFVSLILNYGLMTLRPVSTKSYDSCAHENLGSRIPLLNCETYKEGDLRKQHLQFW